MEYKDYQYLVFSRTDRVLTVTFNRPERLNAWTHGMHAEMEMLFRDLARDRETDIVVLTGAGRAFSAGGDVSANLALHDDEEAIHTQTSIGRRIIGALLEVQQPIICRMNGDAVGAGATMALFCDIIIAADTARIGDPHVKVGLVAGDGGAIIWPQLIGHARAKPYLFTGDLIGAKEAADIGLISFAVPADELDQTVDLWVRKLSAMPQYALRWTKSTVNVHLKQLAASMMEVGMAYEAMSIYSEQFVKASQDFLDAQAKRRAEREAAKALGV